jgi:hypothetical protein
MKINYKDTTNQAASFILTALHAVRDAESELQGVERDLAALGKLEPPNPHDFLRRADAVQNPRADEADIKSDLRLMASRLNELKTLTNERIEQVKALLA